MACPAEIVQCRISFHGHSPTPGLIKRFVRSRHSSLRAQYREMEHWNELPELASSIKEEHMLVIVTARKGTVSFKNAQDKLPEEITKYYSTGNLLIIFPDQHGDAMDEMSFATPQHSEEHSIYESIRDFIIKKR